MTANELAEAIEIRASIRRKATSRKSVQEGASDRLADQLEQAATMLRQQQAEIEALKKQLYPTPKEFIGVSKDGLPMFKEERNDAGFYMSDAEHYKLKCASQQAEIEALNEQLGRFMKHYNEMAHELEKTKEAGKTLSEIVEPLLRAMGKLK